MMSERSRVSQAEIKTKWCRATCNCRRCYGKAWLRFPPECRKYNISKTQTSRSPVFQACIHGGSIFIHSHSPNGYTPIATGTSWHLGCHDLQQLVAKFPKVVSQESSFFPPLRSCFFNRATIPKLALNHTQLKDGWDDPSNTTKFSNRLCDHVCPSCQMKKVGWRSSNNRPSDSVYVINHSVSVSVNHTAKHIHQIPPNSNTPLWMAFLHFTSWYT